MRANFIAHGVDAVTASRKALAALYGMVQQHAAMLAFVEAFWLMGVVFLLMLPFLPLLQYVKHARPIANSALSLTEPLMASQASMKSGRMPRSRLQKNWKKSTISSITEIDRNALGSWRLRL